MTTAAVATVLMTEEEARACVSRIKANLEDTAAQLFDLHEREGWRALGYQTWQEFIEHEFKMSRQHAHRLLTARTVELVLARLLAEKTSPIGDVPTVPESHARELAPLIDQPEALRSAYAAAVEKTDGKPTAQAVRSEVDAELGRPPRPKATREKRSVSSGAERGDFADAPRESFDVSNELALHGQPERWCQDCGGKYRGDGCPCETLAANTITEAAPSPTPPTQTYQPAPRTSNAGLHRPADTSQPSRSGPPPITLTSDAAGTMRAVVERWSVEKIGEALAEAYPPDELRSVLMQGIDALPTDMLGPIHHRVSVRVRPATEPAEAAPVDPVAALKGRTILDVSEVIRTVMSEQSIASLMGTLVLDATPKTLTHLASLIQRQLKEADASEEDTTAEPLTVVGDDTAALAIQDVQAGRLLRAVSRLLFEAPNQERAQQAIYERLHQQFNPPTARHLLTPKAS